MRYSLQNYTKAFVAALAETEPARQQEVLRRFVALLEKSGDEIHARKIVAAAERSLRRRSGGHEIILESARPIGDENLRKLDAAFVGRNDVVIRRVNPHLLAGVRVVVDGEREFDGSLKGRLDDMFGAV